MTTLPRVNAPGLRVWRAVLLELLRRERAGEAPPSVLALSHAVGRAHHSTNNQLRAMRSTGLVAYEQQMGPSGADIRLTELGRLVARLLTVSPN